MIVFSVETSCDETSVCILTNDKKILSHITHTQQEHIKHGGVIPELASRSHLHILQEITDKALIEAKIKIDDVNIFCATCGPGLIGGLLVGSIFCKALAIGQNKPFIPINHLEGHLLSTSFNNKIQYPHVCLLLTGGHTQIYLLESPNTFKILGETLDDALGEAFDKVSKILGMEYPGGPLIEKKATSGDVNSFKLPHPLIKEKNLNFSFSGIKTAVNLIVKKTINCDDQFVCNIAASFQKTILNILENKIKLTTKFLNSKDMQIGQISLVGGVANNKYLQSGLQNIFKNDNVNFILPPKFMLSDNAAMIAWACMQKKPTSKFNNINFKPNPRLKLSNI